MNFKNTEAEILLVGFGDLSALESEFRQRFAGRRVSSAGTVPEGAAGVGSDAVLIQPVYLLPGFEYEKLRAAAAGCGKRTIVGRPLLSSEESIAALAGILWREYGPGPILFAGHGSRHVRGGAVYARLSDSLRAAGFADAFVGVLEGRPNFDSAVGQLRRRGVSDVRLAPLTLTAGKHVREDVFGEGRDSFAARLRAGGFTVTPVPRTLLDLPAVRRMFAESCLRSLENA